MLQISSAKLLPSAFIIAHCLPYFVETRHVELWMHYYRPLGIVIEAENKKRKWLPQVAMYCQSLPFLVTLKVILR